MSDWQQIIDGDAQNVVHTYARVDVVFTRGQGVYLYDQAGRQFLDFGAGIAVMSLGHGHSAWVAAVTEQARELVHVSNLYHTAPQVELAQKLVDISFADKVFFCNSGAEANEAAIKFARKYARLKAGDGKSGLVACTGGFHGRTAGALSVTANERYREPFAPLVPGATFIPFNDLKAAAAAIGPHTCAVIVEPVQGEGGVHVAADSYLAGLRQLCDEHEALLIFDEVQCGLGRTGSLWAHQPGGVTPDIMTLAKPLAGGLPIGAALVRQSVAEAIVPGDHGSTFAAGPLVCRAALAVLDQITRPEFLQQVRRNGELLQEGLARLDTNHIVDIRGAGLLLGIELDIPAAPVVSAAREGGLIILSAGENVLRLAPPLIIEAEHIESALAILDDALAQF